MCCGLLRWLEQGGAVQGGVWSQLAVTQESCQLCDLAGEAEGPVLLCLFGWVVLEGSCKAPDVSLVGAQTLPHSVVELS